MQADNEDRYSEEKSSSGLPVVPIAIAILVLIAAGYWYLGPGNEREAPPPPDATAVPEFPPVAVAPEPEPAPDIPEPEPVVVAPPEPNEPPPPPPPPPLTLEDSDPVVRAALKPDFEETVLAPALGESNLIERTAALVDLTRQGRVEPKLFRVPPPSGKFAVIEEGDNIYMDPAGYQRYNAHARAISALDPKMLASSFHQFRPLLEEAWELLGYQPEDLDNNLVRALDQVIDAPLLEHPPILVKDVTTYNFADESLEALSPLAKQLIRMGPENQALVQAQARAIREALLVQ